MVCQEFLFFLQAGQWCVGCYGSRFQDRRSLPDRRSMRFEDSRDDRDTPFEKFEKTVHGSMAESSISASCKLGKMSQRGLNASPCLG